MTEDRVPTTEAGWRVQPWLAAHYFNRGDRLPAEADAEATAAILARTRDRLVRVLDDQLPTHFHFWTEPMCQRIADAVIRSEQPAPTPKLTDLTLTERDGRYRLEVWADTDDLRRIGQAIAGAGTLLDGLTSRSEPE